MHLGSGVELTRWAQKWGRRLRKWALKKTLDFQSILNNMHLDYALCRVPCKSAVLSFHSAGRLKATEKIARLRREDIGVTIRIRRQMTRRF